MHVMNGAQQAVRRRTLRRMSNRPEVGIPRWKSDAAVDQDAAGQCITPSNSRSRGSSSQVLANEEEVQVLW